MADWTANSGFGATRDRGTIRRAEPVLRPARDAAQPPRAEHLAATRDWEEPATAEPKPRAPAGAAALAQYNATLEGPLAKARLAIWAGGGALSLLLIAGVGIWGYKLVLREVMGLPVIAAEEGPMRVVPADPGGEIVPQQGFAVNAIPGAGTAAPPSDVLMLAPQTSGLAEEDMQVVQTDAEQGEVMPAVTEAVADPLEMAKAEAGAPAESVAAAPAKAPESTIATLAAAAAASLDPNAAPADQAQQAARLVASLLPADRALTAQEILALADQVASGSQPLTPLVPAAPAADAIATLVPATTDAAAPATPALIPPAAALATAAAPVDPAPAIAVIAAAVPGPSAAPVPPTRPVTLRPAAAPAAALPTAEAVAAPVPAEAAPVAEAAAPAPAAAVAAGTHLVQLGAFDSAEIAASEWARLQSAHPAFLGGREHVIQETQSGGATLYRLRTLGFPERADARILCAALTAEGTDCIPVTVD